MPLSTSRPTIECIEVDYLGRLEMEQLAHNNNIGYVDGRGSTSTSVVVTASMFGR